LTGLTEYIDARLADAHELVRELEGLFDFVLSDANKEWYKNDFAALAPKLEVGGFLLHLMSLGGLIELLDHVPSLPDFETRIDRSSQEGISIGCKK